jgi:hypothetical protein
MSTVKFVVDERCHPEFIKQMQKYNYEYTIDGENIYFPSRCEFHLYEIIEAIYDNSNTLFVPEKVLTADLAKYLEDRHSPCVCTSKVKCYCDYDVLYHCTLC